MRFDNVAIYGVSHIDAPHVITSKSIEDKFAPLAEKIGFNPVRIEEVTGIKERRFFDEGTQPSDVATQAAEKLLTETGLDRDKIGIIISTSVCKDYIEPAVAAFVHGNLKLNPNCINFDIGNACLAFVSAMEMIGNMIERGQVDYGLIVNGETAERAVPATINRLMEKIPTEAEIRENFATLTVGSGAAAMILTRADLHPDKPKVVGSVSMSATEHNRLCVAQPTHMVTDAKNLLIEGVKLAAKTFQKAKEKLGWHNKEFDQYIAHQVSARNTFKVCEAIGINENKIHKIFPTHGNVGPASIPISLSKAIDEGTFKPGGLYALLGIGSGINCSMMEVSWK